MSWIGFWAFVLVVSLASFAVLSVVVSVRAWGDLKSLLSQDDSQSPSDPES